jgi:AcrR family transcriptional regulator
MTVQGARKSQVERRDEMITRLVDAAIAVLCEDGYAGTTTRAVVDRAGVSVGALYRHFPTTLDLVIAAAKTVRSRQFDEFRAGLARLDEESVEDCIELLRAACRRPMNGAWYDLLAAARTDPALRDRLMPFTEHYHRESLELARSLPVAEGRDVDEYATAVFSLIHMLDGEAIAAWVHPQPEHEARRTRQMAALLRGEVPLRPRERPGV